MPKHQRTATGANCGATGKQPDGQRLLQWQAICEPEEYWIVDDMKGDLIRHTIADVA